MCSGKRQKENVSFNYKNNSEEADVSGEDTTSHQWWSCDTNPILCHGKERIPTISEYPSPACEAQGGKGKKEGTYREKTDLNQVVAAELAIVILRFFFLSLHHFPSLHHAYSPFIPPLVTSIYRLNTKHSPPLCISRGGSTAGSLVWFSVCDDNVYNLSSWTDHGR